MKEIRQILDTELQLYPLCSILRIIQENSNSNSETVKRYFFYVQVKLMTVDVHNRLHQTNRERDGEEFVLYQNNNCST